jgi:hypothetical protein
VDLDSTFSPQTPDKPKSRRRYHRGRGRAGNGAKHRSSLLHNSARRTRPGKKGQRLRFSRRGFSRELQKVDSDIRSHSLGLNFSDNKVSVSSRCDLRPPLAKRYAAAILSWPLSLYLRLSRQPSYRPPAPRSPCWFGTERDWSCRQLERSSAVWMQRSIPIKRWICSRSSSISLAFQRSPNGRNLPAT